MRNKILLSLLVLSMSLYSGIAEAAKKQQTDREYWAEQAYRLAARA